MYVNKENIHNCISCEHWGTIKFLSQFSADKIHTIYVCQKLDPPRALCDRGIDGIPEWCPYDAKL